MARVCVIRQFFVPFDTRVRREVEALVDVGHVVDVICLRGRGEPMHERRANLTFWRLPLGHRRSGLIRQLFEYATFFLASATLASLLHARRQYDLVQVNSMPDALVFSALLPRALGLVSCSTFTSACPSSSPASTEETSTARCRSSSPHSNRQPSASPTTPSPAQRRWRRSSSRGERLETG